MSGCECVGTNTHACGGYGNQGTCEADFCCEWNGSCSAKTCGHVNNPDLCEGCDDCTNHWRINDARGSLPWNVTVTRGADPDDSVGRVSIVSGGSLTIPSGITLTIDGNGGTLAELLVQGSGSTLLIESGGELRIQN